MKDKFKELLLSTKRKGIEELLTFLESEESDFYTAPSSTKYHNSFEGGLLDHSLKVYETFKKKVEEYKLDVPKETIIIAALLHDLCKINLYKIDKKWYKDQENKWQSKDEYVYRDEYPLGHGEKSVIIAQKYIYLTELEIMLIRWHMGTTEEDINRRTFFNALNKYPAILAFHTADWESSYYLEKN